MNELRINKLLARVVVKHESVWEDVIDFLDTLACPEDVWEYAEDSPEYKAAQDLFDTLGYNINVVVHADGNAFEFYDNPHSQDESVLHTEHVGRKLREIWGLESEDDTPVVDIHFTIGDGPLSGRKMFFYASPDSGAYKLGSVFHGLDGWWTVN